MARGNSNDDLSEIKTQLAALAGQVRALTEENARLRAQGGGGLDGRLLRVLSKQALKEAREDPPDPTPEINVEVAFCASSLVVGRGRLLDREEAEEVPEEELRGFPAGMFRKVTLTIHESELPAFKALCEDAGMEDISRAMEDCKRHQALLERGDINELEGRYWLPAFPASFRRVAARDLNPILYVRRADLN